MNRVKKVNDFIKTLMNLQLSLAFAESMTCGLSAHLLSTCKGTSEVLKGSVVCYTPEMKMELLGVSSVLIRRYSPESRQVTASMAEKLRKLVKADIHAAVTGLASPGGSETAGKPVGTVFYSVLYGKRAYNERLVYNGTPLEIRRKAALGLYDFILKIVA
jgi:nicotinamide-nucleotide amidase